MDIQQISSCQRVTAALFLNTKNSQPVLLLGSGSNVALHVGEEKVGQLKEVFKVEALPCRVIHGFCQNGTNKSVASFGQKAVTVLEHTDDNQLRVLYPLVEYEDWILDLMWFTDGQRYAIITAHNKLIVADAASGRAISSHHSSLNCILYSARLLQRLTKDSVEDVTDLVVSAGTVFNEVVIWIPDKCDKERVSILHHLTGHKGVIFNINVNYSSKLICSVSDDRSIRLWSWSCPSSDCEQTNSWEDAVFHLVSVFNGHKSRVWDACILEDKLISIGEDALLIAWDLDGSITKSIKTHKGKNIWCMAMNDKYVVACGGDSSVRAWELSTLLASSESNAAQSLVKSSLDRADHGDFPREICVIYDFCISFTNRGLLIAEKFYPEGEPKTLLTDANFSGYTVMASFVTDDCALIALGNSKGVVKVVNTDSLMDILGMTDVRLSNSTRVMSLSWLSAGEIIIVTADGAMDLYSVKVVDDHCIELSLLTRYYLPKSKQRFLMAACSVCDDEGASFIVCTDKDGTLYLYERISKTGAEIIEPIQTLTRTHGKMGIPDICSYRGYVYTAGRDGIYIQYTLQEAALVPINEFRVDKPYDWLTRLMFDEDGQHRIGIFYGIEFIVYDITTSQVMMRVDCGGGHRDYDVKEFGGNLLFAYIRDKKTQLVCASVQPSCHIIKPGFHSGKTTCVQITKLKEKLLLITGGDDTQVIISEVEPLTRAITPRASVTTHISSVKCCCVGYSEQGEHILVSGGGRAQLHFCYVKLDSSGNTMTSGSKSIHLSDRAFLTRKQLKTQIADPEMRVMSVVSVPHRENRDIHVVCAGCSDGSLRMVFLDRTSSSKIGTTVWKGPLYTHTHCILTVKDLVIDMQFNLIFAGATDGQVMLFDITTMLPGVTDTSCQPILTFKHHQSGVNAIALQRVSETDIRIVTGGDDNSIVISFIDLLERVVVLHQKIPSQHSTQITGIQFLGPDRFITSSIDQRLIVWTRRDDQLDGESSYKTAKNAVSDIWKVEAVKHTSVADVSGLIAYWDCLHPEGKLITVVGEGISLYEMIVF